MTISAATLGPPVSQAADYWGRKWFVVVLSCGACIGCIVVSRADYIGIAIAGQAIGSLGQGAQPVIHAIASEILPRKYRPLAQSCTNTAAALGGLVGLLVGGAVTLNNPNGFRIYWYIAAGFYAITTLIIVLLYHPPVRELQTKFTTREKLARLDWIGYFLLITGLVLFSFSLTSSITIYPWTSPHILAPLVVGIVLLIAFFVYEWKFTRTGMLHHDLFSRGRNFVVAELCIFVEGMVFFASNNYFGFEIAVLYDQNQFKAGLYYTVAWYTLIVSTIIAGIYCSRSKTIRLPLMLAFGSFTLYNVLMATLNVSTRKNPLGYAIFLGLGLGTALNALVVVAQLSTPPELISITTGLMIATRSFGGTVALSIYTAIFSSTLTRDLPAKVAAATVPLGLKPTYLGQLLGALTSGDSAALAKIPGVSPKILEAAGLAVKQSYALGFRYVWVTTAAFAALAVIGTFLLHIQFQPSLNLKALPKCFEMDK
jgi:MFS family permease